MSTPLPALADLRLRLNIRAADASTDAQLQWVLDVATAWVDDRVYAEPDQVPGERHAEVVEAILLLASRLYARRNTPEGIAGWPELGIVNVSASDPDLLALLERHEDYSRVGFA